MKTSQMIHESSHHFSGIQTVCIDCGYRAYCSRLNRFTSHLSHKPRQASYLGWYFYCLLQIRSSKLWYKNPVEVDGHFRNSAYRYWLNSNWQYKGVKLAPKRSLSFYISYLKLLIYQTFQKQEWELLFRKKFYVHISGLNLVFLFR
jgi:hypothetical protein